MDLITYHAVIKVKQCKYKGALMFNPLWPKEPYQAINWTNVDLSLIVLSGTNFQEDLIDIEYSTMHLKFVFANWSQLVLSLMS